MWASSQKKPSTGWKMFPVRAGRSHFSRSNFQMQDTEDEMSASVCLNVHFSMSISLLYHIVEHDLCRHLKKQKGEVEIRIGDLLLAILNCDYIISFGSEKFCVKVVSCNESCRLLFVTFLNQEWCIFYSRSKTEKEYLISLFSHTSGERWICSCTVSDSDFIAYPQRNCLSIKSCSFTD